MGATQVLQGLIVPLQSLVALPGGGALKTQTAMRQADVITPVELAEAIDAIFQFLQNQESGQISPLS